METVDAIVEGIDMVSMVETEDGVLKPAVVELESGVVAEDKETLLLVRWPAVVEKGRLGVLLVEFKFSGAIAGCCRWFPAGRDPR